MDTATVETTKARRFLFADGDEEILTEYRLNPVMDIPRLRAILALRDASRSEDPLRRRHQALRAMGFLKRIANPDVDERLNNRGYFPHYLTRRGWHWLFERGLVAVELSVGDRTSKNVPHELKLTDLYIALLRGAKAQGWGIVRWERVPALLYHAFGDGSVNPDVYVHLRRGDEETCGFLELENSSEAHYDREGKSSPRRSARASAT